MAVLGNGQFRESAVARSAAPEPLDDLAQLTAPREWAVLACLGLVLAAILAWGVFGSVERTVRSDGVLVLSGERRTVLSEASGAVVEVLAQAGERVSAGRPIARIAALGDGRAAPAEGGEIASPVAGVVAAVHVAPGRAIRAGAPVAEIVSGDGRRLDAVAFVPRRDSWRLVPGMGGRVTVESPAAVRSHAAGLAVVAPRAAEPPDWLVRMQPGAAAGGRGHLVRLAFADLPDPAGPAGRAPAGSLEDGTPCRIEIVLERVSPLELLFRS